MKAQITFRSGAQIEADLEEFTFTKGVVSGDLRQMQWVTPDEGTRKLQYLDHSEVVAVVTFHEPSGEDAPPPPGEDLAVAMIRETTMPSIKRGGLQWPVDARQPEQQ